ncbi:MAG TPA: cytochrome c3 family protein [Candidatus Binatia bacterium]|jgi:hypothetical protein
MAQAFKPSSNTYARLILGGVGVLGGLALLGLYRFNTLSFVTRQQEAREQPIQFSHKHHNGELGIDCRYCHTSVEDSTFAGVPPTQICMNCHSQMWKDAPFLEPVRASYRTGESLQWTRVHDLPDFVYFNHAAHISKGVGCASCHGDMTKMNLTYSVAPLTMGWCLDCHRDPANAIRPKEKVFDLTWKPEDEPDRPSQRELGEKLVKQYHVEPRTDCSTCHR